MSRITNTGDYTIMNSENIKGNDAGGAYFEFLIDSVDKLSSVPTNSECLGCKPRAGSVTVCLDPISLYALSNELDWVKVYEKESEA